MKNAMVRRITFLSLILVCLLMLSSCLVCNHTYKDGVCEQCGVACSHSYSDGECTVCGVACTHSFADGVCTVCSYACAHTYQNGSCTVCAAPCAHSFADGVCSVCGFGCLHNYVDGVCNVCSFVCSHTYVDGVCSVCAFPCPHRFEEGVCSDCLAEDPDFVPADGGRSLYQQIVDKYKYLILYKNTNVELPPRGSNEPFYMDALYEVVDQFDPTKNFGFSYKDINGDGYLELFLTENTNRIYALFTVKDKEAALVTTFSQGMGYLKSDGTVFYNTKEFATDGTQIFLGYHITRLVDGALVGFSYGREDADGDPETDDDIYYRIDEDGTKTVLAYADYKTFSTPYTHYWEYPTRLTKLSNLRFHAGLIDSPLTSITADFSTYDAIIRTFAQMHTAVTGGKCVRSKWIGGAYDQGMLFETDGDFVIYNKLLGASVLVQTSETASFGYARADLNGDGTDELVLMDSKYNVLAIFTEHDGKAVLLDSFSDLRTAFIDADGRIHVKQKVLPGGKNDAEYFVYEVSEGTLSCTVALGIRYTSSTESVKYRIEDGEQLEIETSLWDELYKEYEIDLGINTPANYTKSKSGLDFVPASAD